MSHEAVKALLVPDIVRLISEKYQISEKDALDRFYASATAVNFGDDETGLYGQSALFIFSLYLEEVAVTQSANLPKNS